MPKNREEFFYFILNNSQECIIRYDSHGIISYCNDRLLELTGYSAGELIGTFVGELLQNVFEIVENHIELAEEYSGKEITEAVIYRKNKTCFPVEIKIISEKSNNREVFICTAVDMTRYKESIRKVEETKIQMQESMKARDAFVANVTHELRTPVNGIKGHAEILMEQENDFQKINYIKMILDCCSTMEGIINNILDFSKLEAGKFSLESRKFSFRGMMDYIKASHINRITEKGLEFFMTVSPQIPEYIIGDELRIVQILNNLLSNAQKFTSWGKITVEVFRTARVNDRMELFFLVSDTGIGISDEDKEKLFQSFSQVDASISRKYGGTGLGLNICKQLVELMHGDIHVESEKGKGSTFSFSVKLKSEQVLDDKQSQVYVNWSEYMKESEGQGTDSLMQFGEAENRDELKKRMDKLVLSIEMGAWDKAELLASTLKALIESSGDEDLKRQELRMEMAIRKSNYDKSMDMYGRLKDAITERIGDLWNSE